MAKQTQIPGTERKVQKDIANAGEAYVTERDRRMKLTEKEKAAKDALIAVMRKHEETVYRDDENGVIITLTTKDQVKVTEVDDEPADYDEEKPAAKA